MEGRTADAAAAIRRCRQELAAGDSSILNEALHGDAVAWRHYPEGEVYDPNSHAQYFYHCHPSPIRPIAEHGHFHCFLRAEGMPNATTPLLLPEMAVADVARVPQAAPLKRGRRDEVAHLIAIAIDGRGAPIRLFTTNRWVTGETWYRAEDVIAMLDRFVIERGGPSPVLNRWLAAIVQLFRPQIAALLHQRDAAIMAARRRRRGNVFEDCRLEIPSMLDIDLDARLAALERQAAETMSARHTAPTLPRMAEGWGA